MALISRALRELDICVFIGRFQPLHAGHLRIILHALQQAEHLIVVVGSANQPRRPDANPFYFHERVDMIMSALPADARGRVICIPSENSDYNLTDWTESVDRDVTAKAIEVSGKSEPKISLIGHAKDHTSFYLKLFPQWGSIDVVSARQLDATNIRKAYFSPDQARVSAALEAGRASEDLPQNVYGWLRDFQTTPDYFDMVEEMAFYAKCNEVFDSESYPKSRNTVTGDALIVQSSHVLLVQRGQRPGIGQWALPGGHLNTDETIYDCALREGYEETGIRISKTVFEKSFVSQAYFDAPRRDPRGRYITHTFMFHLQPQAPLRDPTKSPVEHRRRVKDALSLPKVRGADDAQYAKWVHLSKLNRQEMFLDHLAIIRKMTAQLWTQP